MGRPKRGSKRGGPGGGEGRIVTRDSRVNRPSVPADQEGDWTTDWSNPQFERYYQKQNIVNEKEWPLLMDALRRTLPTTFRLPAGKP